MKACIACGIRKPLREYHRHAKMADGHLNKCRDCVSEYVIKRQQADPEAYRQRHAAWRARNPDKVREYTSKQDPVRRAAQSKVAYAIRTGKLVKPDACTRCAKVGKLDAHHDDYSKPLDVVWLCRACHRGLHGQAKP